MVNVFVFPFVLLSILKFCLTELRSAMKAEHFAPILSPFGVFSASLQEDTCDVAFARATQVFL